MEHSRDRSESLKSTSEESFGAQSGNNLLRAEKKIFLNKIVICCERSHQGDEVGDNEEGPPHVGSQGGSEEVTSRAGGSWGEESWAERTAYAKAQSEKEVRIFWNRKKTGRGWKEELGDKCGEAVSR